MLYQGPVNTGGNKIQGFFCILNNKRYDLLPHKEIAYIIALDNYCTSPGPGISGHLANVCDLLFYKRLQRPEARGSFNRLGQ